MKQSIYTFAAFAILSCSSPKESAEFNGDSTKVNEKVETGNRSATNKSTDSADSNGSVNNTLPPVSDKKNGESVVDTNKSAESNGDSEKSNPPSEPVAPTVDPTVHEVILTRNCSLKYGTQGSATMKIETLKNIAVPRVTVHIELVGYSKPIEFTVTEVGINRLTDEWPYIYGYKAENDLFDFFKMTPNAKLINRVVIFRNFKDIYIEMLAPVQSGTGGPRIFSQASCTEN